ncbi:MAG TPA: CPBP family intramembrane glutamic endopeptidase [Chthoniobacterales bacterium]
MSPLLKIALYLLAVLAAAVFLSPPVYGFFQWLADVGIFTGFAGFPFHRFFTRIAQIAALVLLWPLVRWLNIRSIRELGIDQNPVFGRDLLAGFAITLVLMAILGGIYFGAEIYRVRPHVDWIKLLRIAASAAFVGVIEEFLFRAVLLGLAVKAFGRTGGVLLSAGLFAAVHFLRPSREGAEVVTWTSGFGQLFSFVEAAPALPLLVAGMASLFAVGLVLASVTVRTHSLALAIGIHAAWVFGQQSLSVIGKYRVKPGDALLPWVGPNLVSGAVPTGLLPLAVLGVTALLLGLYLKYVPRPPATLAEGRD